MQFLNRLRTLVIAVAVLAAPGFVPAAFAGQTEMDLLSSYIGNWKGSALLTGGEEPETFNCRMTVAKGEQAKINFAGRCALVGLNLSVSGTINYNDQLRRYEAIMTTNTAYGGQVFGHRQNGNILFDFQQRQANTQGVEMSVGSKILLSDGKITVDFQVTLNESGKTLKTSVPFAR
ncbi:MAG TPA: hypothetical protein VIL84_07790 [Devosiaceae bacterium]